ncbi:hypothetical protein OIU34_21420 [Pararhizobium sp. BT-229]|uniref:hypothetical protein n=1 Tax=Pararhizobium sp. BT-229 TaxID=2986923 RepID=UPI0021F70657|nr:hypothetical protein [Pararhizobium sp. BT-229]MCV9964453.1 hypothetical protein [Pararhizobium sp. BT-229]
MTQTVSDIAVGLVKSGVFRETWMAELGLSQDVVAALVAEHFDAPLSAFSSGWFAVVSDNTVAGRTILRIAGAIDDVTVPCDDVAEAIIKMVKYGVMTRGAKRDRKLGEAVAELFTMSPPEDLVMALCAEIGAPVVGGRVDFSMADRAIEPVSLAERDLLVKLSIRPEGHAPTCWLSRRMNSRPSRTTVDYTLLPSVPFILKADKGPARLLGRTVADEELGRGAGETFVGLTHSKCGTRTALEYRVNEEAVEGNSFNVRPEWRKFVHGEFREVNTGKTVKYDQNGRDARKLVGVGKVIRTCYPNYETGESAFVVIDRAAGTATVEVGRRYSPSSDNRIADLLENGVSSRAEHSLPVAA